MALWGKLDTLAASPKYITRKAYFFASAVNITNNTIDLRSSNTDFAVGDGVVYNSNGGSAITGLTSGNTYYIAGTADSGIFKLSDTEAHAKAGTDFIDFSGQGNDAQFLQRNAEGNESTAAGNGDHINNGSDLYFVDVDEAQQAENRARGLKNPGWWLYRSWTNADGSVQHRAECLIALGGQSDKLQATTGDQAFDDANVIDATTSITVQPTDATAAANAAVSALFTVTSTATGAYSALTYQWQQKLGGVWTNITSGAVWTGATTNTLGITANHLAVGDTGMKFRVICGTNTANTNAISNEVTLTVTA
jgi:hypothetical protein